MCLFNTYLDNFHLGIHKDILKYTDGYFTKPINSINPDCICCVEYLESIIRWPQLMIGGRIKHIKGKDEYLGICEWIGLINNHEAVGVKMVIYIYFQLYSLECFSLG